MSSKIKNRKDLIEYIDADSKNYKRKTGMLGKIRSVLNLSPISDQTYIWKYIKTMRYCEYAMSHKNSILGKIRWLMYSRQLLRYAYKTGFQIPPGTIGKGLTIWHWGMIIINNDAVIGENCTLHPDVIIGKRKKNSMPPKIGNNVYICGGG